MTTAVLPPLPVEWSQSRLRFVATINPSKTEVAHLDPETEVSFVPMEAVGEDASLDTSRTKPISEVAGGYTYFRDGDILIAKITPCFENGKATLARGLTGGIGFGSTEFHVVRPSARLNARFVFYAISSSLFRDYGAASMYGAGGQKRVPTDFIADFPLPLPPPSQQRAIADFLDRETAKIDTLIAKQEQLIEKIEEKRIASITQLVLRGSNPEASLKPSGLDWIGDIPDHWTVRSLGSIATKITNGYVGPTRDIFVDSGVIYLQSLHIKSNRVVFNQPYYVDEEWSRGHAKSILRSGDVLIVQTGDIGQVAVVPSEFDGANCHALIVVSTIREIISGEYLSWVLNSGYGFHALKSIQTGALHPHLNCGNVKFVQVPVPPLGEQHRIVAEVAEHLSRYDGLAAASARQIELSKEHRSALINAAITGQIGIAANIAAEAAA